MLADLPVLSLPVQKKGTSTLTRFPSPDTCARIGTTITVSGTGMDDWPSMKDLGNDRENIEVLKAHNRFKYSKPNEFNHVKYIYNSKTLPGFEPIGGHSNTHIVSGDIAVITDINIPKPTKPTNVNGHVIYENLYFKKPSGVVGGTEYPPGSGILYYKKPIHYVLNPQWDDPKIIREMAYAFGKKVEVVSKRTNETIELLGTKYPVITKYFRSTFTDGTKIEFIVRSKDIDPILNTVVSNHLSLMKIVK